MTSDAVTRSRRPRLRNVTTAGSALAVALLPLIVGVLVAKGMAADPHGPVNALITGGGPRAGIPRAEWRRRGHHARTTLRRLRRARPLRAQEPPLPEPLPGTLKRRRGWNVGPAQGCRCAGFACRSGSLSVLEVPSGGASNAGGAGVVGLGCPARPGLPLRRVRV
ncbi:hypothetical protein [Streptomyces sp. PvR034]|uniref:hypothetical protein n=1 Tax=Streptomyces sp. PvR034 TaxID=3156401 RepID=UPI00339A2DEC